MINKVMETIAKERPVGTPVNNQVIDYLEKQLLNMGYTIQMLPFNCIVWEKGKSTLKIGNRILDVEPSPFSEPFDGSGTLSIVKSLEELQRIECDNSILILAGKLTESPLQPKDYPFYYPEEHKQIITLLEQKQPKAIIASTGKNPLNGQNPFPFFEDGNFLIPSGNISEQVLLKVEALGPSNIVANLTIDSHKVPAKSRQIVASKKAKKSEGKIIISAHMDTKYDTPGVLDNATGIAVLLQAAAELKPTKYDIDIVPFNSEEYYGACGELEYLKGIDSAGDKIALMINIDSPGHKGAETAISFHNLNDRLSKIANSVMDRSERVIKGQEWFAGDHAPFVFRGIPCMVVTSSDFFDGALEYTHTLKDTMDTVDLDMIKPSAQYLIDIISTLSIQECEKKIAD